MTVQDTECRTPRDEMGMKSVLITGTNRGIGLESVSQIARLPKPPKWQFAACRNPEQATELQELAASNPSVVILKLEQTSAEDIQAAVKSVDKLVGESGLNLLINNAGQNKICGRDNVTADMMMEHFRVNAVSPYMISRAFQPLLKKAAAKSTCKGLRVEKAAVVNMTSDLGSIGLNIPKSRPFNGGLYPYRASKAALNQITRNLRIDLTPLGILAIVLHPGWVQTEMGGRKAVISTTESVTNILRVLGELSEDTNGAFLNYDGTQIPW